jgi:Cu2+-exporting ATPase
MRLGSAAFCDVRADEIRVATESHTGSTIVFRHGDKIAAFAIEQSVRADAAAAIATLRAMNLDLQILSGDRPGAVAPVAWSLGIDNWRGGLKPADKVAALDALRAEGRRVLMVGDGINDAPSLAAAYVSMSPITAADLSQAQADAVFTGEKLAPIAEAVSTARRARVLMRQNLWLAVIYNLIAVPIAIAGLVTPLIAAAAMSGSSILVTLNALRLPGDGRVLSLLRDISRREGKNPSPRPV